MSQLIFVVTGYCEEHIESMESLCNTIPGDAPLYTMFRKNGDLIKCPFRGPFSFSYTKGARGQVCEYPSSYLDSCSDNRRLKFNYQACLDVEGSEVASEYCILPGETRPDIINLGPRRSICVPLIELEHCGTHSLSRCCNYPGHTHTLLCLFTVQLGLSFFSIPISYSSGCFVKQVTPWLGPDTPKKE